MGEGLGAIVLMELRTGQVALLLGGEDVFEAFAK